MTRTPRSTSVHSNNARGRRQTRCLRSANVPRYWQRSKKSHRVCSDARMPSNSHNRLPLHCSWQSDKICLDWSLPSWSGPSRSESACLHLPGHHQLTAPASRARQTRPSRLTTTNDFLPLSTQIPLCQRPLSPVQSLQRRPSIVWRLGSANRSSETGALSSFPPLCLETSQKASTFPFLAICVCSRTPRRPLGWRELSECPP